MFILSQIVGVVTIFHNNPYYPLSFFSPGIHALMYFYLPEYGKCDHMQLLRLGY